MSSVSVDTARGLRVMAVLAIRPDSAIRIAEFMTALIAVEGVASVVKQAEDRELTVLIRATDGAGLDRAVAKVRGLAAA